MRPGYTRGIRPGRAVRLVKLSLALLLAAVQTAEAQQEPLWRTIAECPVPARSRCALSCQGIAPLLDKFVATTPEILLPMTKDKAALVAKLIKAYELGPREFVWRGQVGSKGTVTITVRNRAFSAELMTDDRELFRARISKGTGFILEQLDRTAPLGDETDTCPPLDDLTKPAAEQACDADRGDTVDVLVLYTPAVRNALAQPPDTGDDQVISDVRNAIDIANAAFTASGITMSLNVVGVLPTEYAGDAELACKTWVALRDGVDPEMARIRRLRREHKADIVVLLVDKPSLGGYVGFTMQAQHVGHPESFAGQAFAVVNYQKISGPTYGIAHEIGHLMGAEHDITEGRRGAFTFSAGFVRPTQFRSPGWRTIMAGPNQCGTCIAEPFWSTPRIPAPNGEGASSGLEDNVQTLQNTRVTAARFMCSTP